MCGSADLLEEFGVRLLTTPDAVACAIREVGIGFMFAPAFHPAMKHAQPARAELKMRTVFNLLGPLVNPAGATRQLIGAPSVEIAELMANALARLGSERAFVVHGSDGLDEVTISGSTDVFEVHQNRVTAICLESGGLRSPAGAVGRSGRRRPVRESPHCNVDS